MTEVAQTNIQNTQNRIEVSQSGNSGKTQTTHKHEGSNRSQHQSIYIYKTICDRKREQSGTRGYPKTIQNKLKRKWRRRQEDTQKTYL